MFTRLLSLCAVAVLWTGGLSAADDAAIAPAVVAPITAAAPSPIAAAPVADIDRLVAATNPNMWTPTEAGQKLTVPATNAFSSPASNVARRVQELTWTTTLVFIPFLIFPLLLIIFVIFKFRDRGDDRPAATFMGNHTIEIVWTAIPILALLLVVYPLWVVLDYMESPPTDGPEPLVVTVIGKSFSWDYEYKIWADPVTRKKPITLGLDAAGAQEALVLPKGRPVVMNFTSNDVNHAWWVPAFGVKRDCIKGRFTNAWFTPDTVGVFKGQCVELCGHGHGIMLISAAVVEPADFTRFVALSCYRDDVRGVWTTLTGSLASAADPMALNKAVSAYLAKGDTTERRDALRFWIASNFASLLRSPQGEFGKMAITERSHFAAQRRQELEATLAAIPAPTAALPTLFPSQP
jgi:cytochrome c oxidase subunit 2